MFLIWCFAGQVDNGGIAQFFFNSTGAYAKETVAALSEAGCPVAARILQAAIDLFPDGQVPSDLEERNTALSGLPEATDARLEALDLEYFATESAVAYDRLWAYWNAATAA